MQEEVEEAFFTIRVVVGVPVHLLVIIHSLLLRELKSINKPLTHTEERYGYILITSKLEPRTLATHLRPPSFIREFKFFSFII